MLGHKKYCSNHLQRFCCEMMSYLPCLAYMQCFSPKSGWKCRINLKLHITLTFYIKYQIKTDIAFRGCIILHIYYTWRLPLKNKNQFKFKTCWELPLLPTLMNCLPLEWFKMNFLPICISIHLWYNQTRGSKDPLIAHLTTHC